MKIFRHLLALTGLLLAGMHLSAAERIPPAPPRYFNDYAGAVSATTANALNTQLEQYERTSSNQLLVAVYPKMESDSSVEDYTVRIAQAWGVGQKGRSNGAVLFVFKDDHKLYLQVGYGLEATLTDGLAHQIIENEIKPRFRAGDYDGGLRSAVTAMIAATQGEYKGTGRTRADNRTNGGFSPGIGWFIALFVIITIFRFRSRSVILGGRRSRGLGGIFLGGGGFGGGGGSSGGGGGFSGGGGSFGGGGAGGSW